MNKKAIIAVFIVFIILITTVNKTTNSPVSDYKLYKPSDYITYGEETEPPGILKTVDENNLLVNSLDKNAKVILGYVDDESYMLQGTRISEKLEAILYFPTNKVIYGFGKDKPINILFGAPSTESGDPYDSPLYIGYYDGTCEYPAEFDYVRSKRKCNQYLQDTLDFVGYNTVDEMLEDAFGEYITKENGDIESEEENYQT